MADGTGELELLWGSARRRLLVVLIWHYGEVSVQDMVRLFGHYGFAVQGRPSKTISDALRWEVGKGRIVRVARGRYAPGRMPRSTLWWTRKWVAERVLHDRPAA